MKRSLLCLLGLGFFACIPPEPPKKVEAPPCIVEPENWAMVIATIGDKHLSTNGYALSRIGDAIDVFRPDMILIDVLPKMVKGEREMEAPLELPFIDYAASTKSTDTFGIGYEPKDALATPKAEKEDEAALARDASGLDELENGSFEEVNGAETAHKVLVALNARARMLKGDPEWARHQAWIEHQADASLDAKKGARRVMVVTNVMHRAAMESHMRTLGYSVKDPVKLVHESKSERESGTVPEQVVTAWKKQADDMRDEARHVHPDHDRDWLEWRVAVLELALRRNGGCCVSAEEVPQPKSAAPPPKDDKKGKK